MWMRGYYDLWYFGQGWDGGQNWDGWDTALVAYLDRRRERPSPLIYVPINVSTDTGEPSSPVAYTPAVDAGAYDVYVLFWSRPTDDDGIMAGLSPSSLMMFERQGCQHVFASDFVTEQDVVVSNDIDLHLYRGYVGRVEVNATRSIKVYMHQLPGEEGANRTWFDGIALRRLPGDSEPASSVAYGRLRVEARSRGNRDLKSKLGVCHVLVVFVTVLPICQLCWSNMEHRWSWHRTGFYIHSQVNLLHFHSNLKSKDHVVLCCIISLCSAFVSRLAGRVDVAVDHHRPS